MKKITLILVFAIGAYAAGIKGVIKDAKGSPLPAADIEVKGSEKGAVAKVNGSFKIVGLKKGNYTLVVEYLGYNDKSFDVEVKEEGLQDIGDLVLDEKMQKLGKMKIVGTMMDNQAKAQMIQKNSKQIKSVIASDRIGKLPDRNAAEAVQRVSGVSIEKDQGEGRFVAVRGLPSDWSSNSLNGDRIPTAEEETVNRSTAFDFFPSEMVDYVEVNKAVTPDMEMDALGGNVNFITKTAPQKRILNFGAGVGGNYKVEKPISSFNMSVGDISNDKKLGYFVSGSYWSRNWATDNYEPRRTGVGIHRLELRDYTGKRDTWGINGGAEYNPDEKNKFYIKALAGSLKDDELHYKHRLRYDKLYTDPDDASKMVRGRIELQNIHDILVTQFIGGQIGGKHEVTDKITLEWKASHYDNEFYYGDAPNADDNSYYLLRFDTTGVGYTGLYDTDGNLLPDNPDTGSAEKGYSLNKIDGGSTKWDQRKTHLPSNFKLNPSLMTFSYAELYKVYINERDNIVASADGDIKISDILDVKAGAKYRNKTRIAEFADEFYVWDTDNYGNAPKLSDFTMVEQPGRDDYMLEMDDESHKIFNKVMDVEDLDEFLEKNWHKLKLDEGESALLSNGGAIGRYFDVNEQHISGYGMATFDINSKLSVLGGLRTTLTMTNVDGWEKITESGGYKIVEKDDDNSYVSILPALHAKYSPDDQMNIRFACTRTFSRPSFESMNSGGSFMEVDLTYFGGNPDVDPTYSLNFDLMVEYFFSSIGMINAGFFYKIITNPIYVQSTKGTYRGHSNVSIEKPMNGDDAWLWGFEFGGSKQFSFLPGVFRGFGLDGNITIMKSEMVIPGDNGDRKIKIPRQADFIGNGALFYELGGFNGRLALNYKGEYIMSHGGNDDEDEYYGKYISMDFSTSYALSKHVTLFMETNNLLNQPMIYYLGDPKRPTQVEYYGIRGQMGVKVALF